MFFSIIVPIYNVEKYLGECLESIRTQTFEDYEVILVDDGSNDGCPVICDEYARQDKRFKVIHKKNGGLVSARKAGAEVVLGEYVLNVDADDYIDTKLLEELNKEIEKYNPDIVAFCYKTIDEKSQVLNKIANAMKPGFYKTDVEIIKKSYLYDNTLYGQNGGSLIFSIWSKAVKKDIYMECQALVDVQQCIDVTLKQEKSLKHLI